MQIPTKAPVRLCAAVRRFYFQESLQWESQPQFHHFTSRGMSIFISVYFFLSVCPMVQVNQWNTLMLLVPALAGLMASAQPSKLYPGGYPRACGEKYMATLGNRPDLGSPPRVRGKDAATVRIEALIGITPACAGKSSWICPKRASVRDHPRVCGEKAWDFGPYVPDVGSPPHARGKAIDGIRFNGFAGITPACAGLMFIPASAARACPAHTLFRRRFLRRPPGESAPHL